MNRQILPFLLLLFLSPHLAHPSAKPIPTCTRAAFEAELNANHPFSRPIGNGLQLFFQPIHSGWILRILPISGPPPAHDYAELATPPYHSVTPLSLSTDFAFRAQDAVGWNPRRFRFAASASAFAGLSAAYDRLMQSGPGPSTDLQSDLAHRIAQSAAGTLTILDARLVPGTADQWRTAAAVAAHFNSTAHTLDLPPEGAATPLGRLVWLRFRVELDLPPGFKADRRLVPTPQPCAAI